MSGMEELFVFQIHFQQVAQHKTSQFDDGKQFSEECLGAHPLGDCNEDRKRDNEEKSPPLQTPWEGNGCHHHCEKAGKYQKDRTGD